MGAKAKSNPLALNPAAMAALLSSVATFVQLAVIVFVISRGTLVVVAMPLLGGGLVVVVYGALLDLPASPQGTAEYEGSGHAFDLKSALIVAASLSAVLVLVAGS